MVAVSLFHCFIFSLTFSVYFQILTRMANISNAEKNMVGLPVDEGEDEEEEKEEEEGEGDEGGHTYNEADIPAENEPEAAETSE